MFLIKVANINLKYKDMNKNAETPAEFKNCQQNNMKKISATKLLWQGIVASLQWQSRP